MSLKVLCGDTAALVVSYLKPRDVAQALRLQRGWMTWKVWMDAVRTTPPELMRTTVIGWECWTVAAHYAYVGLIRGQNDFLSHVFVQLKSTFPAHVPSWWPTFKEDSVLYVISVHRELMNLRRNRHTILSYCIEHRLRRATAALLEDTDTKADVFTFTGALAQAIHCLDIDTIEQVWHSRKRRCIDKLKDRAEWWTEDLFIWYVSSTDEQRGRYQARVLAVLQWMRQHNIHTRRIRKHWDDDQRWLYLESRTASVHSMTLRAHKRARQ